MKWIWLSRCHASHPTGFCGYVYPSQLSPHGASWLLFHSQTSCGLVTSSLMQFCPGLLVFCQAMTRCSVRADVGQGLISISLDTAARLWKLRGITSWTGLWLGFLAVQTKPVSGNSCDLQAVPSFDPALWEQHLPQCSVSSSTLITVKENSPT